MTKFDASSASVRGLWVQIARGTAIAATLTALVILLTRLNGSATSLEVAAQRMQELAEEGVRLSLGSTREHAGRVNFTEVTEEYDERIHECVSAVSAYGAEGASRYSSDMDRSTPVGRVQYIQGLRSAPIEFASEVVAHIDLDRLTEDEVAMLLNHTPGPIGVDLLELCVDWRRRGNQLPVNELLSRLSSSGVTDDARSGLADFLAAESRRALLDEPTRVACERAHEGLRRGRR